MKVPVFYRNLALVAEGREDRWQTGNSAFQLPLGRLGEKANKSWPSHDEDSGKHIHKIPSIQMLLPSGVNI